MLEGRLETCFVGSVNRWECDENDHLNVRFYAHKMNQALQVLVVGLGWVTGADAAPVLPRVRTQHIRFLREARMATPLRVDCAVVAQRADQADVLSLMRNNASGETLAAFLTTLSTAGWTIDPVGAEPVPMPDYAAPRGLNPAAEQLQPASVEQARSLGFRVVGRGVIGRDEADANDILLPHHYIGRISDGMPNLWAFGGGRDDALGGAALEYRVIIREPLQSHCVFTHLAGIRGLASKTQHMAHVLIDETRGRCAATAEAIGLAMDLTTRKAVPISTERRARLQAMLVGAS